MKTTDEHKTEAYRLYAEMRTHDRANYLGCGSFRVVYRSGDWVYKFADNDRDNESEWENYNFLLSLVLPDYVNIPMTELIHIIDAYNVVRPVIVMEYVRGRHTDWRNHEDQNICTELASSTRLLDLLGTNVIINDAGVWPIDLQM